MNVRVTHRWSWATTLHNPRRSFDWAHCICGAGIGGDDYDLLDQWVDEHRARFPERRHGWYPRKPRGARP